MQNASLVDIKKELQVLSRIELFELVIKLAKYKKENKELLNYMLFQSNNEEAFIKSIEEDITEMFSEIKSINSYPAKKSIRKIVRVTNKYIKYSGKQETAISLLLFFCKQLKNSRFKFSESVSITNLYQNQLKKIKLMLNKMHEDFKVNYQAEIDALEMF